jgi:predicted DNA binding CopG/RHH family protein
MEIFYTASFYGKEMYQKYYNLVLKTLEGSGVTVVSPEKGNYLEILTKKELSKLKEPRRRHYEAIKKGILYSDAVVIEISKEDFQLGHEATLAIQNKKHVLCLSVNEDFSLKVKNKYFHGAKYNEANIEEIVSEFLQKVKGERLEHRFNMFLSDSQLVYLEEMADKEGINKSEYLRNLLDKDRFN